MRKLGNFFSSKLYRSLFFLLYCTPIDQYIATELSSSPTEQPFVFQVNFFNKEAVNIDVNWKKPSGRSLNLQRKSLGLAKRESVTNVEN